MTYIDDTIQEDNSDKATKKSALSRGERLATLAQKTVWTVRDGYRQRGESLDASGLKGGISKYRAVGLIFGEEYLTPKGINYDKLASRVNEQNISKLPEVKAFIKRHGGIDPTHGLGGIKHNAGANKGASTPRKYEPPKIMPEPITYEIGCNSPSDLENLLKDTRLNFQEGCIRVQISGPKIGNYLNTLESKGYSVKPLPK